MEEKKKGLSISLTTQILVATVGGIIFGAFVGEWASNLKFIGDIFNIKLGSTGQLRPLF